MSILVTGGAGYIGSHTVKALIAEGKQCWVYDNLSTGHPEAVPGERLVIGELTDTQLLYQTMRTRRISEVVHFAASALVGESVTNPARYYHNNVVATYSLLEAMRQADVGKIVFSSTTATYGVPQQVPIRESERQAPVNPYGFSKFVIEQMLRDYAEAYGLRYAALRYFNAAGAADDGTIGEDHEPESHLIPIVLQVALGQRESVSVFGSDYPTPDGSCIRDYIHVEDLATAHLLALQRLDRTGRMEMNLGTGKGHSVWDVVKVCRRVTEHAIPAEVGPRRAGDPPELVADAGRAAELLGWRAEYDTLEAIVETAWRWHRSHPRGFRS